jgi:aminoglycoside phosphotransferase (APT) family kinase protein
MTLLPGRAAAAPDPDALAGTLASIHATDPAGFPHRYHPWNRQTPRRPPELSARPALWESAIDLWYEAMPAYRPSLIHRDFHPGNVLCLSNRPSGVVDWANACVGPTGCDVATCSRNLADLAGPAAAHRFVDAYRAVTGESLDPFWAMARILEEDSTGWTPRLLAEREADLHQAVQAVQAVSGVRAVHPTSSTRRQRG